MNLQEMIKAMVQQEIENALKEALADAFGSTPQVAKAEVLNEVKHESPKTLTIQELLALEEEPKQKVGGITRAVALDFVVESFVPRGGRKSRHGLKYNKYVSKAVWAYNHLQIKAKYPAVKYSNGHYYADELSDLKAFASSYHIVEHLDDDQMQQVRDFWNSKKA